MKVLTDLDGYDVDSDGADKNLDSLTSVQVLFFLLGDSGSGKWNGLLFFLLGDSDSGKWNGLLFWGRCYSIFYADPSR